MRNINFEWNKNSMSVFDLTDIAACLEQLIDVHDRFKSPNPDDVSTEDMWAFFEMFGDYTKRLTTHRKQEEMQNE